MNFLLDENDEFPADLKLFEFRSGLGIKNMINLLQLICINNLKLLLFLTQSKQGIYLRFLVKDDFKMSIKLNAPIYKVYLNKFVHTIKATTCDIIIEV